MTSALKNYHFHGQKLNFVLYFYSILLYIILHCKYGAPKQAKHEKINVFRPVSEQNFIPESIFIGSERVKSS
jgi:hypothetical protein